MVMDHTEEDLEQRESAMKFANTSIHRRVYVIVFLYLLFRRLLGLENEDSDEQAQDTKPSQPEVSSIAPCVGLCHVERVQELEQDSNLKQLEKEPNECVGLCFIYRYTLTA